MRIAAPEVLCSMWVICGAGLAVDLGVYVGRLEHAGEVLVGAELATIGHGGIDGALAKQRRYRAVESETLFDDMT